MFFVVLGYVAISDSNNKDSIVNDKYTFSLFYQSFLYFLYVFQLVSMEVQRSFASVYWYHQDRSLNYQYSQRDFFSNFFCLYCQIHGFWKVLDLVMFLKIFMFLWKSFHEILKIKFFCGFWLKYLCIHKNFALTAMISFHIKYSCTKSKLSSNSS